MSKASSAFNRSLRFGERHFFPDRTALENFPDSTWEVLAAVVISVIGVFGGVQKEIATRMREFLQGYGVRNGALCRPVRVPPEGPSRTVSGPGGGGINPPFFFCEVSRGRPDFDALPGQTCYRGFI